MQYYSPIFKKLFMSPSIIGLYSPSSGHGKDTVAKIILNSTLNIPREYMLTFKELIHGNRSEILSYSQWTVKKFAYGPKKLVADIYNVPVEKLEDRAWRLQIHPPFDISPLHMVIKLAQVLKDNVYEHIWCQQLLSSYDENSKWIITDVRFPYEYQSIKDRGGIMIRVTDPNSTEDKQAMDGFLDDYEFDEEVVNERGMYKQMITKIQHIIFKYNLRNDGGEEQITGENIGGQQES